MTWTSVPLSAVLAVPVGSTEQHGPHLPLATDTCVAVAVASRLGAARTDVVVAPAVAFGSSGEHSGFAGTLSIGGPALTTLLIELIRSADAFRGTVLVSAHGGNAAPVAAAVRTLSSEGRDVMAWSPRVEGDAHAGRTETSLMLAIDPTLVRLERAEAGDTRPLAALLPTLRASGVATVSPNGVLGDPAGASASEGALLLATMTEQLVAAVDSRWPR